MSIKIKNTFGEKITENGQTKKNTLKYLQNCVKMLEGSEKESKGHHQGAAGSETGGTKVPKG